ncbi:MAG: gliding motility-associated C-terminal domain-containing protein [Flavobacteriales bacterium]
MRSIFSFLLFLIFNFCLAQNGSNIWYFGTNAGLDFSSGIPVPLSNGQLSTLEGCATISDDASGALKFYTDGSVVYNANHQLMPNGTGLLGNSSSTSSALVVKRPGSSTKYIVFTLDVIGGSNGLQYSEVDMTLDGGLGDVTVIKNIPIYLNTSEKIAVIQHDNGEDFWIVIEDGATNGFLSFQFNATGIVLPSVLSLSGQLPTTGWGGGSQGYLKANIAGNRLAAAFTQSGVQIFDFDNSTGVVSNTTPLSIPLNFAYGIEFSPSNQYFYVSKWYTASNPFSGTVSNLYQYDLLAGSEADIIASQVSLNNSSVEKAAIQLGPDLKIYIADHTDNTVSVIHTPDAAGTLCNFDDAAITLATNTVALLGFPVFQNNSISFESEQHICVGDSATLNETSLDNPSWAIQGNPSDIISTDSSITVSPLFTTIYLAFEGEDTLRHVVNVNQTIPLEFGPNICDTSGTITLSAPLSEDYDYTWSDPDVDTNFLEVTETGVYWLEVTDGVCTSIDSIFIQFEPLTLTSPIEVECDSTVNLEVNDSNPNVGFWTYLAPPGGVSNVTFSPNNNVVNPTAIVPELGIYEFMYTNECGVQVLQTVEFVSKEPSLNITAEQQCDFNINLTANSPIMDGHWSVTSPVGTTATIDDINNPNTSAVVSDYGEYTFTFTYDFCEASFSQTVDVQEVHPNILTTQTNYICDLEMELQVEIIAQFENWMVLEGDGILTFSDFESTTTTVSVSDYGQYIIQATGCGGSDTITLNFEKHIPSLSVPEYVDCGLQAALTVDYFGNPGTWSIVSGTLQNLTFDTLSNANEIVITSEDYGFATVKYEVCDTFVSQEVYFMCELDVPNVFTPNNDPLNSLFFIDRLTNVHYDESVFVVYNRWGVEVYRNGQYGINGSWWNGNPNSSGIKDLEEGTYFYELKVHNKISDKTENYKGSINIFK